MYRLRRESRDVTTVPISHSHELTTDFSRFLESDTPKHFWCICRIRRFQVITMTAPVRVLRINYDNLWNSWIDAMTTCMIRRQLSLQVQRQNKKSRQSKFQLTTKKNEAAKWKKTLSIHDKANFITHGKIQPTRSKIKLTYGKIWPVTGQGFQNTKWLAVRYFQ